MKGVMAQAVKNFFWQREIKTLDNCSIEGMVTVGYDYVPSNKF
jgi:hypothetical protein